MCAKLALDVRGRGMALVRWERQDGGRCVALEWHPSGQHLVRHDGQRYRSEAGPTGSSADCSGDMYSGVPSRCRVGEPAHGSPPSWPARSRPGLGCVLVKEDVGRLDVAVQDAMSVSVVSKRAATGSSVRSPPGGPSAGRPCPPECRPPPARAPGRRSRARCEVEDLQDVWVLEAGAPTGPPSEIAPGRRSSVEEVRPHLDRDVAVETLGYAR